MQLSRPLLILPLFFARRLLLFQRRFFDFLFKAPSFSLSGGFFFVVVVLFFFCSDDDVVWCVFFSFRGRLGRLGSDSRRGGSNPPREEKDVQGASSGVVRVSLSFVSSRSFSSHTSVRNTTIRVLPLGDSAFFHPRSQLLGIDLQRPIFRL